MDATMTKDKMVLVVEDDHDVNDMVCEALDDAGYRTVSAYDGRKGLEIIREEPPDVVLLDIILPDTDGVEICRAINQNEDTRGIPVIMMTGRQDLSTKLSSYIAGARRYITKPFQLSDLLSEVEKTLRQKHNREIPEY